MAWWSIPPRAWVIILAELGVIVFLGAGFYSEYVNNTYFQSYVNGLAPVLIPVLSVAFGISSATVTTFLYLRMRRLTRTQEIGIEPPARKRSQTRRAQRKTLGVSEQKPTRTTIEPAPVSRLRPIVASPSSATRPAQAGAGEEDSE